MKAVIRLANDREITLQLDQEVAVQTDTGLRRMKVREVKVGQLVRISGIQGVNKVASILKAGDPITCALCRGQGGKCKPCNGSGSVPYRPL